MFEKIRIIFTIPELRQKILLTLGLLAIYRVGWQVPLPIVDPAAMRAFAEESGGISDLLKTVADSVLKVKGDKAERNQVGRMLLDKLNGQLPSEFQISLDSRIKVSIFRM